MIFKMKNWLNAWSQISYSFFKEQRALFKNSWSFSIVFERKKARLKVTWKSCSVHSVSLSLMHIHTHTHTNTDFKMYESSNCVFPIVTFSASLICAFTLFSVGSHSTKITRFVKYYYYDQKIKYFKNDLQKVKTRITKYLFL